MWFSRLGFILSVWIHVMTSETHNSPYRCYYTHSHLYESNQVAIPFFEFHIVVPPIILLYYHINNNHILTHFIPCCYSSHSCIQMLYKTNSFSPIISFLSNPIPMIETAPLPYWIHFPFMMRIKSWSLSFPPKPYGKWCSRMRMIALAHSCIIRIP